MVYTSAEKNSDLSSIDKRIKDGCDHDSEDEILQDGRDEEGPALLERLIPRFHVQCSVLVFYVFST